MPLVKVKPKYQIVIPQELRRKAGLEVGDLLEAKVEQGKITFTPKSVVDRELAKALEDIQKGRVSPAFRSARAAIRYLHRQARKLKANQ